MSRDQFPLKRDLAVEMTSLLLQLIYGDKTKYHVPNVDQTICKYYPMRYQSKNFLRYELKVFCFIISNLVINGQGKNIVGCAKPTSKD